MKLTCKEVIAAMNVASRGKITFHDAYVSSMFETIASHRKTLEIELKGLARAESLWAEYLEGEADSISPTI